MSRDTSIAPLPDRGWIRLSGKDALGFLHDQVSADLESLDEHRVQPGSYCSPKGRVLAILRVSRRGDALLAELPAGLVQGIARRLEMFVLRADVRIAPAPEMAAFGVWGDPAAVLEELGLETPERDFASSRSGDLTAHRMPGAVPRVQVSGPGGDIEAAWHTSARIAARADPSHWSALDIAAGWPEVTSANSDRFLPQSLALDDWSALNYRKGCYPGQEVIARMHYRGQLKRHLYRAEVEGDPPEAGTSIRAASGAEAGRIVIAAPSPASGRSGMLAVLRDDTAEGSRLADDGSRPLESPRRVAPRQQ